MQEVNELALKKLAVDYSSLSSVMSQPFVFSETRNDVIELEPERDTSNGWKVQSSCCPAIVRKHKDPKLV